MKTRCSRRGFSRATFLTKVWGRRNSKGVQARREKRDASLDGGHLQDLHCQDMEVRVFAQG